MTLDLTKYTISVQCGDCADVVEKTVRGEDLGPPLIKHEDIWVAPGPCIMCVETLELEQKTEDCLTKKGGYGTLALIE